MKKIYLVAGERLMKSANQHGGLYANVGETVRDISKRLSDPDYSRKAAGGEWIIINSWEVEDNITDRYIHSILKKQKSDVVIFKDSKNTEEFFFPNDPGDGSKASYVIQEIINYVSNHAKIKILEKEKESLSNEVLELKDEIKKFENCISNLSSENENYKKIIESEGKDILLNEINDLKSALLSLDQKYKNEGIVYRNNISVLKKELESETQSLRDSFNYEEARRKKLSISNSRKDYIILFLIFVSLFSSFTGGTSFIAISYWRSKYENLDSPIETKISDKDYRVIVGNYPNGQIKFKSFYLNGFLHKEDGPAFISYHENGSISLETYFINGIRHRENDPAYISYYSNGNVRVKQYFLHGKMHRQDSPAYIEYYKDGSIWREQHWLNGVRILKEKVEEKITTTSTLSSQVSSPTKKKVETSTRQKTTSDNTSAKNIVPHIRSYYRSGRKVEEYNLNGLLHRKDGPAVISYYPNGNIELKEYYINGARHREDGPAYIRYDKNGDIKYKGFWINGIEQ